MSISPVRRHSSFVPLSKQISTPRVTPDPTAFRHQTSFSEKKRTNFSVTQRCPVAPTKTPPGGGALLASLQQRFDFLEEVGEGDFSKVYKVRDKSTGCVYALKGLKKKGPKKSDIRQAQQEFENGSSLSHPNCLQYYDSFSNWENIYILIEFMETSLDKYLLTTKFPEDKIWTLMTDIVSGLAHIHSHGLIHFDIKPENVLLEFDDQNSGEFIAKIGDFGLAKGKEQWRPGDQEGDKYYMAPELLDSECVSGDPSSDIFSLGVTLLEISFDLNLRECPWNLLRSGEFFQQLVAESHNPVSKELTELIRKMMDPNPFNRPTAVDLLKLPALKSRIRQRDPILPEKTPKIVRSAMIVEPASAPVFGTSLSTKKLFSSKRKSWDNGTTDEVLDSILMKKSLLDDFNSLFD